MELLNRPRRLRTTESMRKMVRETRVDKSSLIYPIFTIDGTGIKEEIPSMPGQYRYSVDQFPYALEEAAKLGVNNILLFGIPEHKDEVGSQAYAHDGIVQRALREGKKHFPDMLFIADVCMCEYTSHGHCGILHGDYVDNDDTLVKLAEIASSQAEAGADIVAPSDMMDGHVTAIRQKLDEDGFKNTPIMSYAVKFASAFYGPFRDAADSAPCFGDRKSYQMDFHNGREAMKEALLDVEEGTDFLIVKPAMAYYDLLERVVSATNIPVATYSVSGEYSMVKAAAQNGWIDEERIISEMAIGAYRSGAGMYITYFAKELAKLIDEGKIG
ncbi:MAG: porphobilinogen synthase [Bacillota bacterium]|nr:porphobilinogen synthase [Bacillota bacterium]